MMIGKYQLINDVWAYVRVAVGILALPALMTQGCYAHSPTHLFTAGITIGTAQSIDGDLEIPIEVTITNLQRTDQLYQTLYDMRDHFIVRDINGRVMRPVFRGSITISGFTSRITAGETVRLKPEMLQEGSLPSGTYSIEAAIPIRNVNGEVIDRIETSLGSLSIP